MTKRKPLPIQLMTKAHQLMTQILMGQGKSHVVADTQAMQEIVCQAEQIGDLTQSQTWNTLITQLENHDESINP